MANKVLKSLQGVERDGDGRIEQYHAHDGNDAALVPQRNSVNQKTGVFVSMGVVDCRDPGFGDNVKAAVGDHLRNMLAERGVDINIQKSGVRLVDVNDGIVDVGDDDTDFHILDQFFKKT